MRVLSINYPKTESDEEKLQLLVKSYEEQQRAKVDSEMSRSRVPEFDLLSKKRYRATLCK